MRGLRTVIGAVAVFLLMSCGGDSGGNEVDPVAVVRREWGECLRLVGIAVTDAEVTELDNGEVLVEVDGAAFIVDRDGPLEGAATADEATDALLNEATAAGGDCG